MWSIGVLFELILTTCYFWVFLNPVWITLMQTSLFHSIDLNSIISAWNKLIRIILIYFCDQLRFNLYYLDANEFISLHRFEFDQMSMKQTNSHCSNKIFVINWSWINFDCLILMSVFGSRLNYVDANKFIAFHWFEFDHISMKHTYSHCSNKIFVINWGLICNSFDYLLL